MSRTISIGLGIALVALTVLTSSCGGEKSGATVLTFWAMGNEGENLRELIPEFERRNPGIQIRIQAIPWTAAHEKLLTSYAGNSMPDVFQLGNTWVPEFSVLGAIEDLRPWLRTSAIVHESSYFPGIWATNIIDSAVLGIPWYVDTRVLFYRKDLFQAAGYSRPPRTWTEWKDLSHQLTRLAEKEGREAYAILMPTNEWAPTVILGLQRGSTLLKDQNTRGDFSGSRFREAFEFYSSFFKERLAPIGVTQVTNVYQGIAEGFFAMYITGPWNIGEFHRRLPAHLQDQWMTAPLPGPDMETPGVSLAGGSSLAMARSSLHKQEVWKLIEYLSDPAQQLKFYQITGDLPARRETWRDTALRNNPYAHAFESQLDHVVPTPQIPQWEQIAMKVQEFSEISSREKLSIEETLSALDRSVDVILEKRRWLVYGR
jgi:multiple sugar transport system substrate-binding protein